MKNYFNDVDLFFKDFFKDDTLFTSAAMSQYTYPVDVIENEEGLKIDIAAVGLDREDISIEIENGNEVRVKYEKKSEENSEKKEPNYYHRGISRKSFNFGWKIGNKYDISKIDAKLDKGLLTISFPFAEKEVAKKIEIK